MEAQKIYRTAAYIRISKEDDRKEVSGESNSIQNQRQLIADYVATRPEFLLVGEETDDGYSGVSFDRPGFLRLMQAVRMGEIDCVIVKDLSRFGRNYIQSGRYLQQVFPQMGLRFISILDHYDSNQVQPEFAELMLPFRNLMNDAFSRDVSLKVRSQLEQKRKQGKFTGAFPPYGYRKSRQDKNRLEPDPGTAWVVQKIYGRRLDGFSCQSIGDELNRLGISAPLAYKKEEAQRGESSFPPCAGPPWNPVTVRRILTNQVYCGDLLQGKRTRLSYKIHRQINQPRSRWTVVEQTHLPLISRRDFHMVAQVMNGDSRVPPGQERQHLLSGLLFCGHCHRPMIRRQSKGGYVYQICSGHKKDAGLCAGCSIREQDLTRELCRVLAAQIGQNSLARERIMDCEYTEKGQRLLALLQGDSHCLTRTMLYAMVEQIQVKRNGQVSVCLCFGQPGEGGQIDGQNQPMENV